MKILIFGAGGMIGHKMFRTLTEKGFSVVGTLKQARQNYEKFQLFNSENCFENINVENDQDVTELLVKVKPDVILNCIGITLRKPEIKDEAYCKKINSLFPHDLEKWCAQNKSYLIHFSTDCVFSGKTGPYSEATIPDAIDIYGRTKAAGEVTGPQALTLRSSMIGHELFGKTELLEWALSQKNKTIKGYTKAMYSGVTTSVMAKLVAQILNEKELLTGLYQVSSTPISKYDLLQIINNAFKLNSTIEPFDGYSSEKILNSEKLTRKMGFHCPNWPEMVDELTKDLFKYHS